MLLSWSQLLITGALSCRTFWGPLWNLYFKNHLPMVDKIRKNFIHRLLFSIVKVDLMDYNSPALHSCIWVNVKWGSVAVSHCRLWETLGQEMMVTLNGHEERQISDRTWIRPVKSYMDLIATVVARIRDEDGWTKLVYKRCPIYLSSNPAMVI